MMDDKVDTPRTCEACGGVRKDCEWCTEGFQNPSQFAHWRKFRAQFRNASGTTLSLQAVIEDTISRLLSVGSQEATDLAMDGKRLVLSWSSADITVDRGPLAKKLVEFHATAMDALGAARGP